VVEFKIQFSKYDYFGILIPGILFLLFIVLLLPFDVFINLNNTLISLDSLQFVITFLFGTGLLVIAYILGLILSGVGRWIIEDKIIKKSLGYPSINLFKLNMSAGDKKRLFKKYRIAYSSLFINKFNNSFKSVFGTNDYKGEDKFKLCFTIVKEYCPITFGRMNTFIALYGLNRTLSITFGINFIIYIFYSLYTLNLNLAIFSLILPLLSLFCFSNYLKFLRAYSDEIFRTFYIYSVKVEKRGGL